MKNQELAAVFNAMADIMEIIGEDHFRINSYRKAARAIEDHAGAIEDVAAAGKLQEIASIGKSTAEKIDEFLATGKIARHQELLAKIPPKLPDLLAVPGLGPKTVAKLWKEAAITSRQELEDAIEDHPEKLTELPGFGARKVRQIWESLAFLKSVGQRMRLGEAQAIADELIATVRKAKGAGEVQAAGSLRRGKETIGDVDILCKAGAEDAPKIIEAFTAAKGVKRVLAKGETKGSVVLERGVQADLRVVEDKSYGAALAYFTGSKEHNVRLRELAIKKGLRLNEYGLNRANDAGLSMGEVHNRIREDLEWKGIAASDLGITNENSQSLRKSLGELHIPKLPRKNWSDVLRSILEVVEDRLMLHFGEIHSDSINPERRHLPRFNNDGPPAKSKEQLLEVWETRFVGVLQILKKAFETCVGFFEDDNGWGRTPKTAGFYVFRTRFEKKVVYVGIATRGGVKGEISTQTGGDEKGSTLVDQSVKWLHRFTDLGPNPKEKTPTTFFCGSSENEIYGALDLPFIPSELREDKGEIEAAAEGGLPTLLELADIRGDLHMHTVASDGVNTIDEMVEACRARGYQFMAICDHSKSQVQANGLDEKRLAAHAEAIRKAGRKAGGMLVLAGVEVDIFKDGSLDFEADVLAELDFVTASPHTALKMGGAEATERLIRAIENPRVHCIGHPTGRLINSRPGMEIDIDKIAQAAAANGVALEINANYLRLDLRDVHVRAAIKAGAKIVINSDSHSTEELDMMRYGVITARRGWAEKKDIINTLTAGELKKWLMKKATGNRQ